MATAHDVVSALDALHTGKAEKIAHAPTGVNPGYDPFTGITWTEDGRARYRSGRGGIQAIYKVSGGFNVTHSTTTVDFATMVYDPLAQVTTGASWKFTPQQAGFYQVLVNLSLETQAGWGTGFNSAATLYGVFDDTSGHALASGLVYLDRQYPRDGDNNIQVFLHGLAFGYLDVGDTLYTQAIQESLTSPLVASAARSFIYVVRI